MKLPVCSNLPPAPKSQTGAALIIALLIVATVVGIAVGIAADFQLTAARAENRWHGAQAREYLYGSESLAVYTLSEDENLDVDHLWETWASELPPFPVDGGWVAPRLIDAQGRFNINSMMAKAQPTATSEPWERFTPAQRRFMRLLQTFEEVPIDQGFAQEITEAVIDWLDEDEQVSGFAGAESDYYRGLDNPYRAANQPMKSISELRLVRHMPIELYKRVKYELVALPEATPINLNTASLRLMSTINNASELTPLTLIDGETMVAARGEQGYEKIQDFMDSETPSNNQGQEARDQIPTEGLTIKSEHFLLLSESQIGRQRRQMTTLLKRNDQAEVDVIWRYDGSIPVYETNTVKDDQLLEDVNGAR